VDWLVETNSRSSSGGNDLPLYAWFDENKAEYSFAYSEITGYALTCFSYLYKASSDGRLLAAADRASSALDQARDQTGNGFRCVFPAGLYRNDPRTDFVYTFDCFMIVNGLLQLYRLTKRPSLFEGAKKCADWLLEKAALPSGFFMPVYDCARDRFAESPDRWSLSTGAYQAKSSLALLNLYELTQDSKYLLRAIAVCEAAIQCQSAAGEFPVTHCGQAKTLAHPHAYAAEGLWTAGRVLRRSDFGSAARSAAQWLLHEFDSPQPSSDLMRNDVLAQTLRLALITDCAKSEADSADLALLLRNLRNRQCGSLDVRANGGIYFGRGPGDRGDTHVNSWTTMFFIQSSLLAESPARIENFIPFDLI
jgi:hypothetical protein